MGRRGGTRRVHRSATAAQRERGLAAKRSSRRGARSFGEFLEHGDNFIRDAFACAGFGVAVKTSPHLVTTQLVSLQTGQVTDPIIGQFRDIGVTKRGAVFDVEAELREVFSGNTD